MRKRVCREGCRQSRVLCHMYRVGERIRIRSSGTSPSAEGIPNTRIRGNLNHGSMRVHATPGNGTSPNHVQAQKIGLEGKGSGKISIVRHGHCSG